MKLINFFASPAHADEEEKRKIYLFIKVMLLVALIALPILSVLKISRQPGLYFNDYVLFSLTLLIVFYLLLLNKNVVLVSILFILTSWFGMTAIAAAAEGIHNVTIIAYILIIFIAALLSGYRMALLITIMSILSVWIMAYLEIINRINTQLDSPLNFSRDYTVITIMVITLIILYERSFQLSYNRINKELQERKKAEGKLLENEFVLKEQNEEYLALNEELTESNSRIMNMNLELNIAKEKAEQSDRLKTAFLQNISHEIRTPLNGIMGFTELLRTSNDDQKTKAEYHDIIRISCINLASLMEDLIDISKIEAGIIDIHIARFSLVELFKEIELFYTSSAINKNLKLSFSCEANLDFIETDRGRIIQILNNLISNALKFTPSGFVKIHAKSDDNNLVISVADSGIGIKNNDLELIFDRFTQADMGLNRTYGGTGLGLSIAKGLVEYLGGKITVKSELEKGSEFMFRVPVVFNSVEQMNPSLIINDTKSFSKKVKILIAEDEDINFFYLRELFKRQNCEITRASNGQEAVDLFVHHMDFDIVLMDIKMPVMNGYEATRVIKSINQRVPIIAVTAFVIREDQQRPSDINFDDYITKPISQNHLFDRINSLLGKTENHTANLKKRV